MLSKHFALPGALLVLLSCISPLANARFFWQKEEKPRDTYISGSYGAYQINGDDVEDDDRYYEVGVGAKLSPYFGVEGLYSAFGAIGHGPIKADLGGFSANIVGYFPITKYAELYLKGGIFFSKFELNTSANKEAFKDEQPSVALGINVKVTDPLTVFAEFSRYQVRLKEEDLLPSMTQTAFDVDSFKIGAKFMF